MVNEKETKPERRADMKDVKEIVAAADASLIVDALGVLALGGLLIAALYLPGLL